MVGCIAHLALLDGVDSAPPRTRLPTWEVDGGHSSPDVPGERIGDGAEPFDLWTSKRDERHVHTNIPHLGSQTWLTVTHPARPHNCAAKGERMRDTIEQRRQDGVTLLELIVAVTAAMILASIAVPAYTGYVTRARVAVAIGDIGRISLQLYRWQLNTRTFPATLAAAGLEASDPWGKPYQYVPVAGTKRGALRKDRNLVPINTDFDLYSMGPDGNSSAPLTASASLDDVVRANDGSFVGVAKDY